jgi:urease accessory protein
MLRILPPDPSSPLVPAYVRAAGGVRLDIGVTGRGSRAMRVAESGGYRVRCPNVHGGPCEAILINTGGGMAGGDHMRVDITASEGASAIITTQAAEKIYRAQAEPTRITARLKLENGAQLHWLPQETILFDASKLVRTLDVDMPADAELILCESVIFGRTAMGETLSSGLLHDRWRVRRAGRLAFAEDIRLDGDIGKALALPAIAAGATAMATLLLVAQDAAKKLDMLRLALADAPCEAGVSLIDGMLIARLIAHDALSLRNTLAQLLMACRNAPMPKAWRT